jgi:amino acid transporter
MAIGVVSYVIPPFLRDIAIAGQWMSVAALLEQRPVRLGLAILLLWTFVLVNWRGVSAVSKTLIPLMVVMFICSGLVIVTGFSHEKAEYIAGHSLTRAVTDPTGSFWTVVPPASAVLFSSFIGFDAIAQAGGEARDPERSMPRAILLTILIVGVFYFTFTAAVYHAVPWQFVAYAAQQGDVTAPWLLAYFVSSPVALLMVAGAAVALINDLPGMLLGVSRLCFAWAEDGVFPAWIAQVHPRHHTPHVALIVSALLATASIIGGHLADDFFLGVDILVTAMLVNFVIMALAVLALPRRNPALAASMQVLQSVRARWVVAVPAIGLLLALLVAQTRRDLGSEAPGWYAHPTLVWLVVMALGLVIYWRETRALAARGVDLQAITRVLPPE